MVNPLMRWRSSRRHALLGLLAMLMLALPASRVLQADLDAMHRAEQETAGLRPAWDVLEWMQVTQRHRGLSNGVLSGDSLLLGRRREARDALAFAGRRAVASVTALGHATLTQRAERLEVELQVLAASIDMQGIAPAVAFKRHSELVADELALLADIANHTGIALHAQPSGHHLQVAVLQHLPELTERLGRLRGEGTRLLITPDVPREVRAALAVEGGLARASMQEALKALARSGFDREPASLSDATTAARRATGEALALAERELLGTPRPAASGAAYFDAMTVAIDKQFQLMHRAFDELHRQLDASFAAAQRRLVLELAALALLAGLGLSLVRLASRAELAREASDARSAAVIAGAPEALVVVDRQGRIVEANPTAHRLFGADSLGAHLQACFDDEVRGLIDDVLAAWRRRDPPSGDTLELTGLRADGSRFDAELLRYPVGPESDPQLIVVVRDISERRRLERQLGQSQKMEAVGQLTGGIAHDFNNLLGVIVGNLDLAERAAAGQDSLLRRLGTAQKAALRGADLTRRLLAFSRRQHLDPAPVTLSEAIADVVEMTSRTFGPQYQLTTRMAQDTPRVMVDASGLENVLLNLLVNARDAMPGGGSIEVEACATDVDEHHPAVRAGDLVPGRYAGLRITDTGQGIPADRLDKVFEPFFTTKEPGKGTGLGLAMVYGFVRQSGGNVKIYSELGVGTTVAIVLPVAPEGLGVATAAPVAAEHHARPGATALVVDDEPDLLEVAMTYLQEMGYRVLRAGDGASALRTLAAEPDVDLLVTDVVMPGGMSGVKLSQQVRRRHPGVRVVFTSGFPAQALSSRSTTRVDGPLVNKPFQRREFASALNRAMEGEPA